MSGSKVSRGALFNWSMAGAVVAMLLACSSSDQSVREAVRRIEHVGTSQAALTTTLKLALTLPATIDFRTTAVSANEQLRLYDRSQIRTEAGGFAPVVNAGTVTTEYYVGAQSGSVTSAASINLHENSKVNGSATTAGVITKWAGASVTGTSTQGASLPATTLTWTVPFVTSSAVQIAYPGQTITLAPGAYSQIIVYNGAKVKLSAGTYYVDQLNLTQLSNIELDTTGGPIKLYVKTSLVFRASITSGSPDRFLLGYFGSLPVVFDATFRGTVVAPNAPVRFATPSAQHIGSVFAKSVEIDPDTQFTYKPFANWDDIQFDVMPRFECVQTAASGQKSASFGYINPNNRAISVPVGSDNQFSPTPGDRRQPTTFLAGTHGNYFSIGYTGSAPSWQLNGTSASVDASKICNNGFEITTLQDATLSSASPNANFGATTSLEASNQKASVVKFDRKAILTARGVGRLIKSAKLELSVSSGSSSLDAYPMRQEWDETGATWSCGKDQDASATGSQCFTNDRWNLVRRQHTWDNPYNPDAQTPGTASSGKVTFDVTADLQQFLVSGVTVSWIIQSHDGTSSTLFSREGNKPAKLIIDTAPFTDTDLAGQDPFSFSVDTSLATTDALPPFADGHTRQLAVLRTSEGDNLEFVQDELLVLSDDPTVLAEIKGRWNATEIAAPSVTIPGVTKGHVLRIDTSRPNPATLVPNLRETVNRPDGLQKVSSNAALAALTAMADEQARGNVVGVNWLAPGAEADIDGFNMSTFTDGLPVGADVETSSNAFAWPNFITHGVTDAWKMLFFTRKLKPTIDVAMIDAGLSLDFQDEDNLNMLGCASGECKNPFNCGGGNACPWHGVETASAGFGVVNNKFGGAGPGAGVTDLTLLYGFGDMGTTLISVPSLVAGGEQILNFSNAIPVPDWASPSTAPAEVVMYTARHIGGMLIFAAAGNSSKDVDERRCFNTFLFGKVCPWEKTVWFPCEGAGVDCVGATDYIGKGQADYSNFGGDVKYYATGTMLVPGDPDHRSDGTGYHSVQGTSFSSPFMAGTAALTWAADTNRGAGDVEDCLDAARDGGPNGRYVNTLFATACALGNPSNLAPIVDITNPADEDNKYETIGVIRLEAKAGDFEDGPLTDILWTSDVDGMIGTSSGGQPMLWQPPTPGLRTVTAKVFDSGGKAGSDSVTLSFTPATPNLRILAPATDDTVFLGLPVDLIGKMTNFTRIGSSPPYDTSIWVGYHDNSILFDHLMGAAAQATFNQVGGGHVTWSMTVDGQTGTASRSFTVVSDGKLHVKITSPAKDNDLTQDGKVKISLEQDTTVTLSAVSTSDVDGGVNYSWNVSKTLSGLTTSLASPTGQSASFTPTGFGCGFTPITVVVTAINKLGEIDHDSVVGFVHKQCEPK